MHPPLQALRSRWDALSPSLPAHSYCQKSHHDCSKKLLLEVLFPATTGSPGDGGTVIAGAGSRWRRQWRGYCGSSGNLQLQFVLMTTMAMMLNIVRDEQ